MRQVAFFSVAPYERPLIEAPLAGAECRYFTGQPTPEALAQVSEAEVLSVFVYDRVDAEVLARLPKLRMVATRSTGYDHIDLAACRARDVQVSNVPSYGENTVAEHAFMLIFALARQLKRAVLQTQVGDFSLTGLEGFDLLGKTLGVVGAGRIGLNAIRIGQGVGMRAIAYDTRQVPELAEHWNFRYVSLEELLESSDVVSIHAALTPETHHLIGRAQLARMRLGAILVNTARGPIVDTQALCEALDAGALAGAGLDVFEGEELLKEEPALLRDEQRHRLVLCQSLLSRNNVVLTPHSAFFTREGVGRLVVTSLDNIRAYLAGQPQHLVTGA